MVLSEVGMKDIVTVIKNSCTWGKTVFFIILKMAGLVLDSSRSFVSYHYESGLRSEFAMILFKVKM